MFKNNRQTADCFRKSKLADGNKPENLKRDTFAQSLLTVSLVLKFNFYPNLGQNSVLFYNE